MLIILTRFNMHIGILKWIWEEVVLVVAELAFSKVTELTFCRVKCFKGKVDT